MQVVTDKLIDNFKERYKNSRYSLPKWIRFCETMLNRGYKVSVYMAKTTFSKYVYVSDGKKTVKIRFSNHKPNYSNEMEKDSDFYVGVNNKVVTTTEQVIPQIIKALEGGVR